MSGNNNQPAKPNEGDGHGKLGVIGALGAAAAYFHHEGKDSDSDSSDDDHHGLLIGGAVAGVAALAFFYAMRKRKQRDFVVVVDASASMQSGVFNPIGGTRWSETQKALNTLATEACKSDPDGLTIYFFNDRVQRFNNIKTPADVSRIFATFQPAGFTDLTSALDAAFQEHFGKAKRRPTNILVIHDGEPNDQDSVSVVLRRAADAIHKKKELQVSFVQVGDDPKATAFLNYLDTGLGTKFDIVDTVRCTQLAGSSFSDAIGKGLSA